MSNDSLYNFKVDLTGLDPDRDYAEIASRCVDAVMEVVHTLILQTGVDACLLNSVVATCCLEEIVMNDHQACAVKVLTDVAAVISRAKASPTSPGTGFTTKH